MFSRRVPHQLTENRLARAVARARHAGQRLLDLTITNPTTVGIPYPADLLAPLATPEALVYRPAAFGLPQARDAVSRDFARRGLDVPADRLVLTASTSDAYSWLFKLCCDPGDRVLAPRPSYPLFDHLAALDAVQLVPYRLEYHGLWSLDRESLTEAWSPRTRVVLAVAPNNPTGSLLRRDDVLWLREVCAARRAALVSDEVFADYLVDPAADAASSVLDVRGDAGDDAVARPLMAVLGGLSKSVGLPQVKVGWMALDGPPDLVEGAFARLELIADTYLSVSTPAQDATPHLLRDGAAVRDAIAARVRANHATLRETLRRHSACTPLRVEGGWSAVVRVPATRTEEDLVERLVEREGVLVHPGYFFDFPHEAFVVVSLLGRPDEFAEAVDRLGRVASS